MIISLIVAFGKNKEIGLNNKMLWHIPEDFKNFKKITMGHCMLMGRKTYQSIGRPLPGRTSIVLTRDTCLQIDGVEIVNSFQEALEVAKKKHEDELFIVGGAEIYKQFIDEADYLYLSYVDFEGEADAYFPEFNEEEFCLEEELSFEKNEK